MYRKVFIGDGGLGAIKVIYTSRAKGELTLLE